MSLMEECVSQYYLSMIFADTNVNSILSICLMFHLLLNLMNLVGLLTSTLTVLKF